MEENQNKGRNYFLPLLALLKRTIIGAFEVITKNNIFDVKVTNDKVVYSYMAQISQRIDKLIQSVNNLPKIELKDTPASIQIQTMGNETIGKIVSGLLELKEAIKQNKPSFPSVQKIQGSVKVENPPYFPHEKMLSSLRTIEDRIGNIRLEVPKQEVKPIKFPEFPKELTVPEMARIIDAMKELKDEIRKIKIKIPEVEFPSSISVNNFPPQKYPLPVTHISINSLAGTVKSRSVTVTTSLTPLPEEVLADRRSLVIYNNSSVTVEIGGSTFTFGDGLPIPGGTFSPALDAGSKMIIYGRVASGTADVRTLEVSDLTIGR